ncbi:MAG: hypothetical protein ABEJ31_03980 [Haloarculaceae archaeon]
MPETNHDETTSRRSLLRTAAVSAAGLTATAGVAAGQDTGGASGNSRGEDYVWHALADRRDLRPDDQFAIVSDVVRYTPRPRDVRDSWFHSYNTRKIRWIGTGEVDRIYVAADARLPEYDREAGYVVDTDATEVQPQLWSADTDWSIFGDNARYDSVSVNPLDAERANELLADQDWWRPVGGT